MRRTAGMAMCASALLWLILLALFPSDCRLSVYMLQAAVAFAFGAHLMRSEDSLPQGGEAALLLAMGALFALTTEMASITFPVPLVARVGRLVPGVMVGAGFGTALFWLFDSLRDRGSASRQEVPGEQGSCGSFLAIFLPTFIAGSAVFLGYLFLCNWPGTMTADSLNQLEQILSGSYTNHHPFWHTMIIRLWVSAGLLLTGDLNVGVGLYSIAQALAMAGCFAYAIATLRQTGARRAAWVLAALAYIVLPYNIAYSVTMWKDVLFGGALLVAIVASVRAIEGIGRSEGANLACVFVGSLGMALLRNNGLYVVVVLAILTLILFARSNLRLAGSIALALALALLLRNPIQGLFDVAPTEPYESLSIPLQQMARVASKGRLAPEERAELEQVFPVGEAAAAYNEWLSNPVKWMTNAAFIDEHPGDFLGIWARIGKHHPIEYLEAWIMQTRGYWHGGYSYWVWAQGIEENSLGVSGGGGIGSAAMNLYLALFELPMLDIVLSIGIHDWILLFAFAYAILRRDLPLALASCVPLLVIATLLIATPVANEFRYAYCTFSSLPFLMALATRRTREGQLAVQKGASPRHMNR